MHIPVKKQSNFALGTCKGLKSNEQADILVKIGFETQLLILNLNASVPSQDRYYRVGLI